MPLTKFQSDLARLLSANRSFDSYLAGAAAILIEPNTSRYSRDLDYFHDSEARVAEAGRYKIAVLAKSLSTRRTARPPAAPAVTSSW